MVLLIRHAQSTFNAFGDKGKDVPITDKGREVAKLLTGHYDLVICSTLKRTRETLDASSITYKNIMFTDLCREFLDGNPVNLYNGEENWEETLEQLDERIKKFKVLAKEMEVKHGKVAVITHSSFLTRMTGYRFDNCFFYEYKV